MKKRGANCSALFFDCKIKFLRSFHGFKTSGANVAVDSLSFRIDVIDFLNVSLKRSSRSSLGVADVVTRHLPLSAYATNSGHNMFPPATGIFKVKNNAVPFIRLIYHITAFEKNQTKTGKTTKFF